MGRPGILSGGLGGPNVNCLRRSTLLSLVFKAVLVTVDKKWRQSRWQMSG